MPSLIELQPDVLVARDTQGRLTTICRRAPSSRAASVERRGRCQPAWYFQRMADRVSKLEARALELPPALRARLAERLISSLDLATDADAEEIWIREAARRLEEVESRGVEALPAERAIEKARSSLRE